MVVKCEACGRAFDDIHRSWNCPHKRLNPGYSVDLDPPRPGDVRPGRTSFWANAFFLLAILAVVVLAALIFRAALLGWNASGGPAY